MTRTSERRLHRLEAALKPVQAWRCHTIMGHSHEELEAKKAELMASPEWSEDHHLIAIRFVSPCEVKA
jgi:hypothetical protein